MQFLTSVNEACSHPLADDDPPPLDAKVSPHDDPERLDVGLVLLLEDAGGESLRRVVRFDTDGPLHEDRAPVEGLIDQVDGAPGDLHAVRDRLRLRVDARERWKERG